MLQRGSVRGSMRAANLHIGKGTLQNDRISSSRKQGANAAAQLSRLLTTVTGLGGRGCNKQRDKDYTLEHRASYR